MLDVRTETFLVLAKTLNYTNAAKELFITQPAVTQHIQFLEGEYGVKLFDYSNRQLSLTNSGNLFLKYIQETKASNMIIKRRLLELEGGEATINFSATLTIGEFTLAPIIKDLFNDFNNYKINFEIHNTEHILKSLNEGDIEFALIEGLFNKNDYCTKLLKEEEFVLVVSPHNKLGTRKNLKLFDILNERIIVREKGSGSREILERGLYDKNCSLDDFIGLVEIGNVGLMKRLVMDNVGISFMYRDAAKKEIEEGALKQVDIKDFKLLREFNFVTIDKPSIIEYTNNFYKFLKENI